MNSTHKEQDQYPVKRRYYNIDKHRVWNVIEAYKREVGNAHKFAVNLRDLYVENFKNGPALLLDGSDDVPVRHIGVRRLRQYFDMKRNEAVTNSNIEDVSWRFLDRVSRLIRKETSPDLDPSIFEYFDSRSVQLSDININLADMPVLLTSSEADGVNNIGIMVLGAPFGHKHLKVRLWVYLRADNDPDLACKNFREGRRSDFILWEGLLKFTLPMNRKNDPDMIFSNHDASAILHEAESRQPGALIIRNLSDSGSPLKGRCTFRTPNSELKYTLASFDLNS